MESKETLAKKDQLRNDIKEIDVILKNDVDKMCTTMTKILKNKNKLLHFKEFVKKNGNFLRNYQELNHNFCMFNMECKYVKFYLHFIFDIGYNNGSDKWPNHTEIYNPILMKKIDPP